MAAKGLVAMCEGPFESGQQTGGAGVTGYAWRLKATDSLGELIKNHRSSLVLTWQATKVLCACVLRVRNGVLCVPLQASTTARKSYCLYGSSQGLLKIIGQTNAPVLLPLGMIYFPLFV